MSSSDHYTYFLLFDIYVCYLINNLKNPFFVQVVGPLSNNVTSLYGDYSPTINETLTSTPLDGLSQLGVSIISTDGCSDARCVDYDPSRIKVAVEGADIVFVCLGTGEHVMMSLSMLSTLPRCLVKIHLLCAF